METVQKKVVVYVASQELAKVSSLLPSNRRRSIMVHSLINSLGLLNTTYSDTRRILVLNPRRAAYKDLAEYHSRDYLDFVLDAKNSDIHSQSNISSDFGLEDDCPSFPRLPDYIQLIAGATLTAVNALRQGVSEIAICWDGGRHHAQKSYASGFCYVADCILAIMSLRRQLVPSLVPSFPPRKPRVMYLDLDLHYSDAVSEAFSNSGLQGAGTSQILTLSIHHAAPGFFPNSPRAQLPSPSSPNFDPFSLSIPLCQGASDSTYRRIWALVEHVKDAFDPDYVVVQCGTDAVAGDPCATLNWSLNDSEGSLGWCIDRILKWNGRKLLLGGGGYNSPNCARIWAYLTSIALNHPLHLDTEIPDHSAFPLYAPSFTLDVPAGNMHDHNTDNHLQAIEHCYEIIIPILHTRVTSTT